MDAQKVDNYLLSNGKYFPTETRVVLRDKLLSATDEQWNLLIALPLKDPQTAFILSWFLGILGVDRFYIGDTGLGVGKLRTAGGCGLWELIDLFLISKATRQKNFDAIMETIQ